MRLIQFLINGKQRIGVETATSMILNLTDSHPDMPDNMIQFLQQSDVLMDKAKELLSKSNNLTSKDQVKVLPPITNCGKIIAFGLNYKDHCSEQNLDFPKEPVVFSKFPSSIIGDGDDIILPKTSDSVDWEVELAVVIGKEGKNVEENKAMEYVAGYMVANDVSARDWQLERNGKQWLLGKTFDTFCPIGPALVTKDSIKDPHKLSLKCLVNGQVMQSSNTNQLIFGIETCISWISKVCTLNPGDILLTGTPPGVGAFRKPPMYLKDGDMVVCEIEDVGQVKNSVVAEK